jgi:predicted DNA-binding protein
MKSKDPKPTSKKPAMVPLTFRVTEGERDRLADYAEANGRTQSDVLRELIRSLPKS